MKILFTSVGRRVELIQAFRHAARKVGIDLLIYGVDIVEDAPALLYCDFSYISCRISDANYIPLMLDTCQRENIDAIIPTIDTDLLILANNKKLFEVHGTNVIVSDPDKIMICRDKRDTSAFFEACGLLAPTPIDNWNDYDRGFPAFIKPLDGSSSINAYKVNSENELKSRACEIKDYIIQPFISGTEYTVDILCDWNHEPILITPRIRLAVRSGEVLKTQIRQDERIISECKQLIKHFQPVGQITVQLIRDDRTGNNYYIEINPRFGGGAPLSIKAGADSAAELLRILSGKKGKYLENAANDGAVYSRFDQSLCVCFGSRPKVKAVIFDLDDTLYNEIDYVISGFEAVEKAYGVSSKELLSAFLDEKPAIDTVLSKKNQMHLKEKCLDTYRTQIPNICLDNDVQMVLSILREHNVFIGIITDGRPEGQKAKIKALGLERYIDEIIITDELGGEQFRKPCDIPYRIMQLKSNVDYSQMLYIGDNLSKDFKACSQLGIQSAWYNNSKGLKSDVKFSKYGIPEIDNISDILNMI